LGRQLTQLDEAITADEMNIPGWAFHGLSGALRGRFAVSISGHWRLTFAFENGDAILLDYQDYH
jgi:proteic killer suppression protein